MSAMVMGPAMPNLASSRRPATVASSARTTSARTTSARNVSVQAVSVPAVPAQAVTAPVTSGPVTSGSHLRLTSRGRAVLWFLAAVVVAAVTLLASQASADGPVGAQEVVRHVVQPGETLWQIAETVATPSEDVRDVVFELVRLNELPDAGLMAGQVIVVPAD